LYIAFTAGYGGMMAEKSPVEIALHRVVVY